MTIPKTENIGGEIVFTPATGTSIGLAFTVGDKSEVFRLTTPSGSDVGVADAFELHTVLEYVKDTGAVTRSYATKDLDLLGGTSYGILLGSNRTQVEVMLRGTYAWKKILATTPSVGVERVSGFEQSGR